MVGNMNSRQNFTELFFAIIISANSINWILRLKNGLAIIVFISFCFIIILNPKKILKSIKINVLFFIFYIYLFFLISLIVSNNHPQTIKYLMEFSFLGVIPILISSFSIDVKKLLLIIAFIGICFIPFVFNFNFEQYSSTLDSDIWGFLMGISYGLLKYILACLILLLIYKPKNKWIKFLLYSEMIILFSFLLTQGSRGALLSAFTCLIYLVYKSISNSNISKIRKSVIYCIISLILIFCIFFTYNEFLSPNPNLRFTEKTYFLKENNDISNGRILIANYTIKKILENPVFGHGIGSFDHYSGGYPHNLFLHFLYEGGILLAIPFLFIIVKSIYIIFSNKYDSEYVILILFLFFSSVIELLFSSQPWISQIFWLYIGSLFYSKKYKSRIKKYGNYMQKLSIQTQLPKNIKRI